MLPLCRADADLMDLPGLRRRVSRFRPSLVFHCAADTSTEDSVDAMRRLFTVNVLGTLNLCDALLACRPAPRLVLAGSAAPFHPPPSGARISPGGRPDPREPYRFSKWAQEVAAVQCAIRGRLPLLRARLFNVTGPGDPPTRVCGALARQVVRIELGLQPPVLAVGNLGSRRDFLDVRDAARALWLVGTRGAPGAAYVVCSGATASIRRVIALLRRHTTAAFEFRSVSARRRRGDLRTHRGVPSPVLRSWGWRLRYSLEQSLADLLESCRREAVSTSSS